MEYVVAFLFFILISLAIFAAVARWIFRVNDIVRNLETIVKLLKDQAARS